jgi:DNA polymerase-3 subunit epsilon
MISFFKPKTTGNQVVDSFLQTPKLKKNTLLQDSEFLVLDFETTGLNPQDDFIVSMGWVVIQNLTIDLKSSRHIIIDPKGRLTADSVLIHHLTDDEVKNGVNIKDAMGELITTMQNKVLIVHYENIEKNFINQVCKRLYNNKLPMQIIDTLKIQTRKNLMFQSDANVDGLRLFHLRDKYNLPRYKAHNAMLDAVATAEVFLAQISWMGKLDKLQLRDVL